MRLTIVILLGLITQAVNGQTKKVEFYGYRLMQYQSPVLVGDGIYNAYYKNIGEVFSNGRFELDESRGTFLIKWEKGDDWFAQYSKKITTTNQEDLEMGDVTQINYVGKWIDNYDECELRVLQTKNNECVIELRTGKAIDTDKGINAWKKVFRFFIRECFNNVVVSKVKEDEIQKLNQEKTTVKEAIAQNKIFKGEDISECARFIGNSSGLLEFYKSTPENRFTLPLLIDESGAYKFQDNERHYTLPTNFDTILLKKILKFSPAKRIVGTDSFYVKSEIILSFADRNGDGIHYSPSFSAAGAVRNKNNSIELISLQPNEPKQILLEKINSRNAFRNKKAGIYQLSFKTVKLNIDISILDVQGRYCHSQVSNKNEVIKSIIDFYGQGASWQISY
jgi:hypothetical protein